MARPGFRNHPKFRRLVDILSLPEPHVYGICEFIWQVAYENGKSEIGDEKDVELAAHWTGEAGKLCRALLECGGGDRAGLIEPVNARTQNIECAFESVNLRSRVRANTPTENADFNAVGSPCVRFQVHDLFDHAPEYVGVRGSRESERKKTKTCQQCSCEYRSTDIKSRFCSASCRSANYRQTQTNAHKRSERKNNGTPAPAPAPAPPIQIKNPLTPAGGGNGEVSHPGKTRRLRGTMGEKLVQLKRGKL